MSDLTSVGYGRRAGAASANRPAARNGDVRRGTSYNETCVLLSPRKVSSVASTTGGQHRPALIYVFFLPKLKLGFGSELGSGEIWNAEKA